MLEMNRRTLVLSLPGMFTVAADAESAQSAASEPILSAPRVLNHDDLPVKKNANGSETRPIVQGAIPTGEAVQIHETTLAVGGVPNPPHAHRASDFILVREGIVAFEHDGKSERVAAGGIILATSGTTHTIRNVGDVPARYFVVTVGRDEVKKPV